jgi:mannosyltransferase
VIGATRAGAERDNADRTLVSTGQRDVPKWGRGEIAWVSTLTAAVALAGFWHLGRAGIWNDEAATWAISGHGFTDLVHALRSSGGDRGAALYYFLEFGWLHVFGTSEFAMRSLSVVAAAGTIVPFHAVARRLLERPATVAAGAMLATSVFFLTYARDARAYAVALLLVVLAAWTFLRAFASDTTRDWWIFSAVALLAVYTHWFSALVVLSFFIALRWTRSDAGRRRHVLCSAAALTVGMVPIAGLVLSGSNSGVDWIADLNATQIRQTAAAFAGSTGLVPQLVMLVVFSAGLVAAWQHRHRAGTPPLALTWFVVPVGLTVLISTAKPLLVPRYLIIALPGLALILGLGAYQIGRRRRLVVAAVTVAVIAFGAWAYDPLWSRKGAEDWQAIAATVAQRAGPRDAVVVFPATSVYAFSYYARESALVGDRAGTDWPPLPWDAPFDRRIANSTVLTSPALRSRGAVWLVIRAPRGSTVTRAVRNSPVLAELRDQLRRRFSVVEEVAPWSHHDTVFVVRYSEPTSS